MKVFLASGLLISEYGPVHEEQKAMKNYHNKETRQLLDDNKS